MTTLIVQVLGNSDIQVDGAPGCNTLSNSYCLEDIEEKAAINEEELIEDIDRVNFPLIKKLSESPIVQAESSSPPLFCFLLTDQRQWQSQRNETGEGWNQVVALDGIWWQKILGKWCETHDIQHSLVTLTIDPSVENGVADWDGMAQTIERFFASLIRFEENGIFFQPQQGESIPVEKITVQHSSGTPALNGALYLWGIERKLTRKQIDFVYISEQQLVCEPHSGTHWQWHLKVPQIRELLKIQDFSGALQILQSHPHSIEEIETKLQELDRAVSLNLTGRSLTGREGIIERVAIAVWSETAFRDRSQWMHWYLRVAGAFELVIMLLVEQQGNGDYEWEGRNLICKAGNVESVGSLGIVKIVCSLLSKGKIKLRKEKDDDPDLFVKATKIQKSEKWSSFKKFYCNNWQINENINVGGFTNLRNELYHSLLGDIIDKELNERTLELGSVTDDEKHPAQVAVDYLHDIIDLAGLKDEVKERADRYSQIVRYIEENL
ncbi:hypothetical protein JJD41_20780 [Oxynema sp. CENA135]|uniref:hypothetical protein n=1 Tax=Oxynema sp. CENA135 TaxID=984206 RepID=UPI00190CBD5A|nr:hypothetical protein [Oxynema sp. CENA135]MBK4732282.1 hypothetical protein [Oxynema sp. CENA135]